MANKFIDLEQLGENSFIGNQTNNQLKINVKIASDSNNRIQLTNNGLLVPPEPAPVTRSYIGTFNASASPTNTRHEGYRKLTTAGNGNIGILHLDFSTTTTNQEKIFILPADAPRPVSLCEVQVARGTSTGSIWIDANSRDVYAIGLPTRTRIIVDLIGFWR